MVIYPVRAIRTLFVALPALVVFFVFIAGLAMLIMPFILSSLSAIRFFIACVHDIFSDLWGELDDMVKNGIELDED